jgi:hypothetical protein
MKSWKVGDILALSNELRGSGTAIADGCSIFVADVPPREAGGKVWYGYRDAKELRPATFKDFERLLAIRNAELQRAIESLDRLTWLLFQFTAQKERESEQAKD